MVRINLDTTLEGQRQAWHTVALYTWYYFHSLSIHQAFRIRCLMHHHTDFSEQDPGWGGAVPLPHPTLFCFYLSLLSGFNEVKR